MVNFKTTEKNRLANYDSSEFDLSNIPEERNLQDYLQNLRELISRDKKLKCPLDDETLSYFIRGRKYNVVRAFKSIKSFFNLISTSPEFLSTFYPSAQVDLITTPDFCSVSKCRSHGTQIFNINIGVWDLTRNDAESFLITCVLTLIHLVKTSAETNISGVHLVIDVEGFSIDHLRLFTLRRIRKVLAMLQDGFPVRLKGVHLLNNHGLLGVAFNLVKPFLKDKLRRRIIFHGHKYQKSLCRALGASAVPENQGGNVPDGEYANTEFYPELLTQDGYYKEFLTSGYGYGKFIYWKEFGRLS